MSNLSPGLVTALSRFSLLRVLLNARIIRQDAFQRAGKPSYDRMRNSEPHFD